MLLGPDRQRLIELICISFARLPDLDNYVRNKLTTRVDYRTSEQTLPQAASSLIDRLAEADLLRTFLNEFEKDYPQHSDALAQIRRAVLVDMSPQRRWISPRLTSREAVPLILAVAAALFILTQPFSNFLKLVLGAHPPEQIIWTIFAPVAIVAGVLAWKLFRKRSRLLQREKFLILPEKSNCFIGRDDEVSQLSTLCDRRPLVLALGESGSGKSTLVRFGLLPKFMPTAREIPHWHAVLLDGADIVRWEDGLGKELTRQLKWLPEDIRKNLGAGNLTEGQDVFDWINSWPTTPASRLLIVIDQLDDYFETHRQQLMQGSVLLAREELLAANREWNQLKGLIDNERIHVLLISRNDSLADRVFRVCDSYDFFVPRVDANLVAPLLDQISAPDENGPVVENPDAGWTKLSRRLMDDLGRRGGVLMIQLVITLDSLRRCDWLDLNEYTRRGGMDGLGRIYVDRRIEDAAQLAGFSKGTLLQCLVSLSSMDGSKTLPVPTNEFVQKLSAETSSSINQSERTIDALCQNRILRRRSSIEGELLQLYHDYLARPIRESYRLANAKSELLESRAKEFAHATIGERWKLRLTTLEQLRLFCAWLRGQLTYGNGVALARWSLAMSILIVGVSITLAGLSAVKINHWKERMVAEKLIGQLGDLTDISGAELNALERLSESNLNVRRQAFEMGMSDEHFGQVITNFPVFLHTCLGLDDELDFFATAILKRLEVETDSDNFNRISQTVGSLSTKLDATQTHRMVAAMLKRIEIETKSLHYLVEAVAVLSAKLDAAHAQPFATAIMKKMEIETDSDRLGNLGKALWRLSNTLDAAQIQLIATAIVKQMKIRTDSGNVDSLANTLGNLSANVEPAQIQEGAAAILHWMANETNPLDMSRHGKALGSLSTKLDPIQKYDGAKLILACMVLNVLDRDSSALSELREAFESLPVELPPAQLQPLIDVVAEKLEMENVHTYTRLYWLNEPIKMLSDRLTPAQLQQLASAIGKGIEGETDPDVLLGFLVVLRTFYTKPHPQASQSLGARIVARMEVENHPKTLVRLGEALGVLSVNMEPVQISMVVPALIKQMGTESADLLLELATAFEILSVKLDEPQVQLIAKSIVNRMETPLGKENYAILGAKLGRVSAKLDSAEIHSVAVEIVKRMETEQDPLTVHLLGIALASLSANLDLAQIFRGAAAIVRELEMDTDSVRLGWLGDTLGILSTKLDQPHVQLLASSIVKTMENEIDSNKLAELGATLGKLSAKLNLTVVRHGVAIIANKLETETEKETIFDGLSNLCKALGILSAKLETRERILLYTKLLKAPQIVGKSRDQLLKDLDKSDSFGNQQLYSGIEDNLDVWKFVDWANDPARGGKYRLDLRRAAGKAQFRP